MFSLFDALLLRPLPVDRPEQLVSMMTHVPRMPARSYFPFAYYEALQQRARTVQPFGETGEYAHFRLTAPEPAQPIVVHAVTSNFFAVLGVRALMGRVLTSDDERRHWGMPPAVLSYNFWQRRLDGDKAVVRGKTLDINGRRFAIVGIMPRDFNGLSVDTSPDVRIPLQAFPLISGYEIKLSFFEVAGRLQPGVSQKQAQAECLSIWQTTMLDYYLNVDKLSPKVVPTLIKRGMKLQSLQRGTSVLRASFSEFFRLLMAAVGLLVLIIALNVSGLLLAQAAARRHEMAVRLAIGGTPLRLASQMVSESILLTAVAAACGLLVALAVTPVAVHLLPPLRDMSGAVIPLSIDTRINGRILLFLLALSALVTLIFTIGPILSSLQVSIDSVLRTVRSSNSFRRRQLLIVLQIGLCTFLLIGASLLVRSLQRLQNTSSGFASDSIATFSCDLEGYKDKASTLAALTDRIGQIPGVVSVATSSVGVMRGHGMFANIAAEGQRVGPSEVMATAVNQVSADYFGTMGVRTVAGRDLTPGDARVRKQTGPVKAVVNESFVRHFFGGRDPLGQRFGTSMEGSVAPGAYEIVGVVSDAKYRSLEEPIRPMCFTLETNFDSFVLYVRTRMRPQEVVQPVQRAAAVVAPGLPFLEVNTLAHEIDESTAPERVTALLASFFGGFATLVAGIGVYGLLAFAVTQRRREIGIRVALGAQARDVAQLFVRQTLVMTVAGVILGFAAAVMTGPAVRFLLYGVSASDPPSFVAAAVFVLVIAAMATALPVLNATEVQAAETLRLD